MLVDILFAMGMVVFVLANFKQLQKIYRTHKTNGISVTHYKLKFIANVCIFSACVLGIFPIAFITNFMDMTITTLVIIFIAKYRKLSIWRV